MRTKSFNCDILNLKVTIPCKLKACGFWCNLPSNLNCIQAYSNGRPLEIEEISFILNMPLWLATDLKELAILKLKRQHLKFYIKDIAGQSPKSNGQTKEIQILESFYKADIRVILSSALKIYKTISLVQKVLGLSQPKIKSLIQLYIGDISSLESIRAHRIKNKKTILKRTWHYPQMIEEVTKLQLEYLEPSKLNFREVEKNVNNLIS